MSKQKWIFHCDEANLIFAARSAGKLCRRAILGDIPPEDLAVRYEFENGVIMDGCATKSGTFIVRQAND